LVYFRSKKTVFLVAIATVLILTFSSYTQVLSSATASGFTLPCTITTSGSAWNGEIAFDLYGTTDKSYLVVMDTNGTVLDLRESAGIGGYNAAYFLSPDLMLFQGEPVVPVTNSVWSLYATHLWNLASNTTEDFPNVLGEHDIQYDPVNNTFLTLQDYVKQVGDNLILYDKIVQLSSNGTILWSWDTYNHIPLSEASPFNETELTGNKQTVLDFTHANSLDWDYNDSIIYLNIRNTNTFYKINQTTGNIIWACGEYGNFTLLGANGQPLAGANGLPPSLWYHSHDLKEVAPDVFTIFNNDYDNNTNPDDCHSSLMEVTLNETSMTAYINWNWEAPTKDWNSYGGATLILPNGDYLGDFGDPTHQEPQNQLPNGSWNFNNTGAVFVEVNPAGQVVRTWTFPVGYYVYRVEALTNATQISLPTTPSPSSVASLILPVAISAIVVTVLAITVLAIIMFRRKTRATQKINNNV